MKKIALPRVYNSILLITLILCLGTGGYILFFGYSFVNAIYMTIITITTVGFGEVHPFNTSEKIFTIFLILSSLFIFGYAVSSFSEYLISGHFFEQLKLKKNRKMIKALENHVIVCGYGRNGKQAIEKLMEFDQNIVVIEQNPDIIKQLELMEILIVKGDATSDEILIEAGIKKAKSLITALPSDADNLFVVLTANQLNKNCKIISRASEESSYKKLKFAGAENVIMPDKLGGVHMATLVNTPDLIEFVDRLTLSGEKKTNLEEVAVNDLPKEYIGKTILDLDLRKKTGCNVIGFKTENDDYIINPDASTVLEKNTCLILLGKQSQIQKLRKLF